LSFKASLRAWEGIVAKLFFNLMKDSFCALVI